MSFSSFSGEGIDGSSHRSGSRYFAAEDAGRKGSCSNPYKTMWSSLRPLFAAAASILPLRGLLATTLYLHFIVPTYSLAKKDLSLFMS